jgi:hypothetical protein
MRLRFALIIARAPMALVEAPSALSSFFFCNRTIMGLRLHRENERDAEIL